MTADDKTAVSENNKENKSYIGYEDLILKSLIVLQKDFASHIVNVRGPDYYYLCECLNIACKEIEDSIKNKEDLPNILHNCIEITIEIFPNYNTSSHELYDEIMSIVPILDIIHGIDEYYSNENRTTLDVVSLFADIGTSIFTSKASQSFGKNILGFSELSKSLGTFSDILTIFNFGETIYNWNSSDKQQTYIIVSVKTRERVNLRVDAIVDENLNFDKETPFIASPETLGGGCQVIIHESKE